MTLDPTSAAFDVFGGSSSVSVTAVSGCAWTASSPDNWITVTGGSPGDGNGTVTYSVAQNTSTGRSGQIFIGDQTFTVDQADACMISIDDVNKTEGDSGTSQAELTISLSRAETSTVAVTWSTSDGTADTSDYVSASGTAVFSPGETTKTVNIDVIGDTLPENDEVFNVDLTLSSGNAVMLDNRGICTIYDDDQPPPIDGTYTGLTSQGRPVSLTVSSGVITSSSVDWSCYPALGGTASGTWNGSTCSINATNRFACGSSSCSSIPHQLNLRISGAFSGTSVSGLVSLALHPCVSGCSCCYASGITFTAAHPLIFEDGFETGDSAAWSSTVLP